MTAAAILVGVVALVGVCVLSRWLSEVSNDIDRLMARTP